MHAYELLVCGCVAALCPRDELGLFEWPAHHCGLYTASALEVPRAEERSSVCVHEPELALRRREPFDAVCGDHKVFLEADVPASGYGRSVLDREHVPDLDEAVRRSAVTVPARRERRPAVVGRAAEL